MFCKRRTRRQDRNFSLIPKALPPRRNKHAFASFREVVKTHDNSVAIVIVAAA